MNFLVWCARSLHLFSMTIWLGGLLFAGGVMNPILAAEGKHLHPLAAAFLRRFSGFTWMALGVMLVTGLALMLYHPRFLWFEYQSWWSRLLLCKQLLFIVIFIVARLSASSIVEYHRLSQEQLSAPNSTGEIERGEMIFFRIRVLQRLGIVCGIGALLLAAGMMVV